MVPGDWLQWVEAGAWPAGLGAQFARPGEWPRYAGELRTRTEQRLADGERDHLAFYVLQSRAFTSREPVVPQADGPSSETDLRARVRDFLASSAPDERAAWLKRLPDAAHAQRLEAACRQVIAATDPRRQGFYLERGLSSDSEIEAGFIVDLALATARELAPDSIARHALIVGPGLDWAPRTGFADRPPQSHQPFAVLDSLIRHGWAQPGQVRLTALDVNPRVIHFLDRPAAEWRLERRLTHADLAAYTTELGRRLGTRQNATIRLEPWVKPAIEARLGNILLTPPPTRFDLAVATNILLYFPPLDSELALHWLRRRANPGAWLIHNDPRPELEAAARRTGWTPRFARRVSFGDGALEDFFALLQA